MISLTPVTFTIRELKTAYESGYSLYAPVSEGNVAWNSCYFDKSAHDKQDICVRGEFFVFGNALEAHQIIDSIDDQLAEEDCPITLDDELIEHFPECTALQLDQLLSLSEDTKFLLTNNNDLRFDKDLFKDYVSLPPDYFEVDWNVISREFKSVDAVINRLREIKTDIEEGLNQGRYTKIK